jgi:ABC-type transport system involved in cytochrome c biogenesis permease component
MSRPPKPPVFLQRQNYRQRRVRDAAKLLPFLGAVLWVLPLSWGQDPQGGQIGSAGLIYIFAVWVLLIVLAAFLANRIRDDPSQDTVEDPDT